MAVWTIHAAAAAPTRPRLRYEELRADTPGTVREIANFIGAPASPLSDDRLSEVLEKTSKEAMAARFNNNGLMARFLIAMGCVVTKQSGGRPEE